MRISMPRIKTAGRATILALVLGASSLAAMPAQAAGPTPNFGFSFSSGQGLTLYFGNGGHPHGQWGWHRPGRFCMTQRDIRRQLRHWGYRNIKFFETRRDIVHVQAKRHGTRYAMDINRCTGQVFNLERLRPHHPTGHRHH